jgi:hypothetical protein
MSTVNTLSGSDLIPVFSAAGGERAYISATNLKAYVGTTSVTGESFSHASPASTGFLVVLSAAPSQTLVLTPAGAYASGSIQLPAISTVEDGSVLRVYTSQAVTAFSVIGGGASVLGEPSALTTEGFFSLIFDLSTSTWYRIG